MVLLKKKPVLYTPLPSLSTILQPLSALNGEPSASSPSTATAATTAEEAPVPADAEDDEEQLERLRSVFRGEFEGAQGMVGAGKGKKAGTRLLNNNPSTSTYTQTNGTLETNGIPLGPVGGLAESENGESDPAQIALMAHMAHMAQLQQQQITTQEPLPQRAEEDSSASTLAALTALGAMLPPPVPAQAPAPAPPVHWRIWDRECYYVPETGEIFTDYEWVWSDGKELELISEHISLVSHFTNNRFISANVREILLLPSFADLVSIGEIQPHLLQGPRV